MSFLGGFGKMIGAFGGTINDKFNNGIGQRFEQGNTDGLMYNIGGWQNKIFGIPSAGVAAGEEALKYYNKAFPGTTPWERLGTKAVSGDLQVQDKKNDAALKIENKRIGASLQIAKMQTQAQIQTAEIAAQAPGRMAGVAEEQLQLNKDRLKAEIPNIDADTQNKAAQALTEIQKLKTERERTKLTKSQSEIANIDKQIKQKENELFHVLKTKGFIRNFVDLGLLIEQAFPDWGKNHRNKKTDYNGKIVPIERE